MHLIPVGGNGPILSQWHRGSQLGVEGSVSVTDPGWQESVTEQCGGCHKASLVVPRAVCKAEPAALCVQEE